MVLNLDAKGRMMIPTRHRDALAAMAAGRLVLTAHPHRCLLLYPEPAWLPIREKILAAPSFDARSAATKRLLVGFAQDQEMDTSGRVLIAPELRAYAGLEKQVWLVGQGSHFEVWSDTGWQEQLVAGQEAMTSDVPPPGFADLSL